MTARRRLGVAAAIVDGTRVPGDVAIAGGRIEAVGLPGAGMGTAVPGFVDLQVNGFAGVDLGSAGAEEWHAAGEELARSGTTAYLPTLITAPVPALTEGLARARDLQRKPSERGARVLGVHLEGPFLAAARRGAHPAGHLRDPDRDVLETLLAAGPVSMVTLAPELPGALDLIGSLMERGVVVSIGHTEATPGEAHAAFDAGARAATHVFNAMPGVSGRNAGTAAVALSRAGVTPMVIADGVHLADDVLRLVFAAADGRVALVSDAMAAAGRGDGTFTLGGTTVTVREGRATTAEGALAGSTGTPADAVRRCVELGVPLETAVGAATAAPARLIGKPELGTLSPGTPADVVVLDEELAVARVLLAGREL